MVIKLNYQATSVCTADKHSHHSWKETVMKTIVKINKEILKTDIVNLAS
jgi:hypothetical protein